MLASINHTHSSLALQNALWNKCSTTAEHLGGHEWSDQSVKRQRAAGLATFENGDAVCVADRSQLPRPGFAFHTGYAQILFDKTPVVIIS